MKVEEVEESILLFVHFVNDEVPVISFDTNIVIKTIEAIKQCCVHFSECGNFATAKAIVIGFLGLLVIYFVTKLSFCHLCFSIILRRSSAKHP